MDELVKRYERLAGLCREQTLCVATEEWGDLNRILDEKDALLRGIDQLLPRARATGDGAALSRALAIAREAAAEEDIAVRSLSASLESVRRRLRQAGEGRAALRSYRPGARPAAVMDQYYG